ncbi:hypothetical protein ACROYT_G031311 [Oculina patagonica]
MSCFLSQTGKCGDSRGVSRLFCLLECDEPIDSHLASIHLSQENITEWQIILARAGFFDLEESVVEKMTVYAKHRHTYGKFWRPRTAFLYPAHQGRPRRNQQGAKSRYSVNLEMSKAIQKMYGVFVQVGSVICINCRNQYNVSVKEMHWVLPTSEKEKEEDATDISRSSRPCKEAAVAQLTSSTFSPVTPRVSRRGCSLDETWTPSALLELDESMEMQKCCLGSEKDEGTVQVFNACIDSLADAIKKPRIDPLESQVTCWEHCSSMEKSDVVQKAEEACHLICDVIAPNAGKQLFQEVVNQHQIKTNAGDVGLEALVTAYQNAPSKSLKTQILSIYANSFTAKELKEIHKSFENLSDRQIKKARALAKNEGPGVPAEKIPQHRIRVDQSQLDHFLEFTMRPYYYQDVAYGTRTLKLDSGEELVMPNVVRTVARCTIINQYLEYCKETDFQPISRSTMWRVLDVQEASQRKSLRGLDNTAADGADGFKDLLRIVDELERVGAEKEWCTQARKRLHEGKLYLKTTYRDHCKQDSSLCPDHCRTFGLSDVSDTDYQTACNHSHDMACESCESLKSVVEDIKCAIPTYVTQLGKEKAGDLQYDANVAASKIFEWKAHVLRAQNQDQVKQQILNSL